LEPFVAHVERPKGFVTSFVYNMLGFGLTSNRSQYVPALNWVEHINPLYKMDLDYDEPESMDILSDEQDENKKKLSKYKVLQRIAAGNEGTIYLAIDKTSNRRVAIKSMQYETKTQIATIDSQISLCMSLTHKNVVKHHDTFTVMSDTMVGKEKVTYLVMDFCSTSLEGVIQQQANIPDDVKLEWVHQIVQSIAYLHRQNIIHRDIKSDNILLNTDDPVTEEPIEDLKKWKVKICDFGSATKILVDDKSVQKKVLVKPVSVVGTPLFMAPEVVMMKGYDFKADLWSLGVVCLQLLLNKVCFVDFGFHNH
jgi:serine/threonine protein kinase